jgi:hypothetical protein
MAAMTMKTKPVDEDREYIAHECVCDVCHGKFTKKQYDSGQICSPSTELRRLCAPRLLRRVWSH